MEATADQIGIALDNARLYSETVRQLEELKRTQAQLVHAEKLSAVGELASGVAHEINNPLTTILGQAHLLLDSLRTYAPRARARRRSSPTRPRGPRASCRTSCLFARHYPPERRPCSLADQVAPRDRAHRLSARAGQIRIVTDFASCPPVWADENQLQQVLLNLVQNAHQAMAKQAASAC